MPVAGEKDAAKPDAPPLCVPRTAVETAASMTSDRIFPLDSPASIAQARRVLIVDDHVRTLAAVAALLQAEYPRIDVVGTASNGQAALRKLRDTAPDVVVLDLDLGGERGLDLMPAIGRHAGVAVIILSSSDDPLERAQALCAGAAAFISKFSPAEELVDAILAACPETGGVGALSPPPGSARPGK